MRQEELPRWGTNLFRQRLRSVAVGTSLVAAAGCSLASADRRGQPDVELRWDNTVKYLPAIRAESRSDTLTKFARLLRVASLDPLRSTATMATATSSAVA